jgi:hypothetical protein
VTQNEALIEAQLQAEMAWDLHGQFLLAESQKRFIQMDREINARLAAIVYLVQYARTEGAPDDFQAVIDAANAFNPQEGE